MSNDFKDTSAAVIALVLIFLSFYKPPVRFKTFAILAIGVPIAMLMMPFIIARRYLTFWSLKKDGQLMKKHVGYWTRIVTGSRHYHLVYEADDDGTLISHAVYFTENQVPKVLLDYKVNYKFHNGSYYQRAKFSKITIDQIIEFSDDALIIKDNFVTGDILHDVRISKEEFDQKKAEFSRHVQVSHWTMLLRDLLQGPGIYHVKQETAAHQ